MTNRRSIPSARLMRVAAPLLLASLTLSACSSDEPDAAPAPSSSPSTSTPSASTTPSSTPTVSGTPSPTPTSSPTATPTKTTAPPPTTAPTTASCVAGKVAAANTKGRSAAAAAKAKKIHAAAKACDATALIALANADSTGLAGENAPTAIFTAKSPQNYVALATLLTMESTETFDGTIQPKVFSERFSKDDAEWDKVIAAGLVTRSAAATMRQKDGGYTGYRAGISSDGTWSFFTVGR